MKNTKKRVILYISLIVVMIMSVCALYLAAIMNYSGSDIVSGILSVSSGISLAVIPVFTNIGRVGDRVTAGKQIHYRIYLLHVDQIDGTVPFPKPNSNREIGSIPLLQGQYWHFFDVVSYSPDDKSSSSKGDITSTVTNSLSFVLGGQRPEVYNFIENSQGELFYVILQEIDTGKRYLYGREFNPYILQTFERTNGKDGRYTTVTFGNESFDMPLEYIGATTLQPATAIAADATSIAFTAAAQYKTSAANTADATIASFTGLTLADQGRNIEILGGGGEYPTTIEDSERFVLQNGLAWTGTAGSSIIFRVLDAATLVEVSRVYA